MRNYIIKRLFIAAIILFFVAFVIYCIMRSLPMSYIERLAQQRAQAPGSVKSYEEWVLQLGAVYGMDKGIIAGFFSWAANALRGNFGDSWLFNMSVVKKFKEVITDSVYLNFCAAFFTYSIAIPLGMLAAQRQYKKTDYIVTVAALIGISLPTFFLATLLKLLFSVKLGLFDLYGKVGRNHLTFSYFGQILDIIKHYILPVCTLTIISVGSLMRYTRTNMLEVLHSDYIRTARSKGLPEKIVIYHHAFRNTLIPLVTILAGMLPSLFSGAMITEVLFQIPGIGYTSYLAITQGDIPFAMFFMVFLSLLTLTGTLISDILYAAVDPRVRIA
ncbi:MAG: ABC transporter permease [Termitinemataceae bacterium]|nr:MAG: ABC transporter permease [Termitinemataceae bacterium]